MIFKSNSLFRGADNHDQLIQIVKILGTKSLIECMKTYNIPISNFFQKNLGQYPKVPWTSFVTDANKRTIGDDAFDLLEKMLCFDKQKRITAREALLHPYFSHIRDNFEFTDNENVKKNSRGSDNKKHQI